MFRCLCALFFINALVANDVSNLKPLEGGVVEELLPKDFSQTSDPFQREKDLALDQPKSESREEEELDTNSSYDPTKRWYFTFKPGYYYFSDSDMRAFFDNGGFTFRLESGCRVYGPLIVWLDASYFQKSGSALGGTETLEIKLANITMGLKGIYHFNDYVALYAGAGPRLFMMLLHNDSPFVRGDDNAIGIGGGFDAGIWVFPVPRWKNVYLDLFADYSLKNLKVDEDEISSIDNDVDVSGFTAGLGLGIRF